METVKGRLLFSLILLSVHAPKWGLQLQCGSCGVSLTTARAAVP
jgi:hypothetical protein